MGSSWEGGMGRLLKTRGNTQRPHFVVRHKGLSCPLSKERAAVVVLLLLLVVVIIIIVIFSWRRRGYVAVMANRSLDHGRLDLDAFERKSRKLDRAS